MRILQILYWWGGDRDKLLLEFNIFNSKNPGITKDDENWIDFPGDSGWMEFLARKFKGLG